MNEFMIQALDQAKHALLHDEVPVGAVVVHEGQIIGKAHNFVRGNQDPTAHAEILALRMAADHLMSEYLDNCDLYVTLEPCVMCAGAISWARIKHVYFGAYDPKSGAVDHGAHVFDYMAHKPEVIGGICEHECKNLLKDFFEKRR